MQLADSRQPPPGRLEVRVCFQHRLELRLSFRDFPQGEIGVAKIAPGLEIVGGKPDGFSKALRGFADFAQPDEHRAQVVVGGGAVWIQLERGLQVLGGFRQLAQAGEKVAEVVVRLRVIREETEGFEIFGFRFRGLAELGQGGSQVEVRGLVFGGLLDRGGLVGGRSLIIALLEQFRTAIQEVRRRIGIHQVFQRRPLRRVFGWRCGIGWDRGDGGLEMIGGRGRGLSGRKCRLIENA